jgi:hypothetical protein
MSEAVTIVVLDDDGFSYPVDEDHPIPVEIIE